ncbi:hypothetical protein [Streptomyces formicae]|uniref:hypothetical protein n=1 Tax=Streptomyces formicae TaxID=1616117 RepID=UPI001F591AD1|nr:hypothetical protein [Streptomyces formicae]
MLDQRPPGDCPRVLRVGSNERLNSATVSCLAPSSVAVTSTYVAPEESVRDSLIDIRTTVFTLGRALRLLLDAGDEEKQWRGTPDQLEVIRTATAATPEHRFPSVRSLVNAWQAAA